MGVFFISLMVIANILYAALFKNIVNLTLLFALFLDFLGRRLILLIFP